MPPPKKPKSHENILRDAFTDFLTIYSSIYKQEADRIEEDYMQQHAQSPKTYDRITHKRYMAALAETMKDEIPNILFPDSFENIHEKTCKKIDTVLETITKETTTKPHPDIQMETDFSEMMEHIKSSMMHEKNQEQDQPEINSQEIQYTQLSDTKMQTQATKKLKRLRSWDWSPEQSDDEDDTQYNQYNNDYNPPTAQEQSAREKLIQDTTNTVHIDAKTTLVVQTKVWKKQKI